jgi:hypothetical protein|tara:strand:+ start:178 stop:348 length:171 start_codon:yes stop_codon:yes gene_type:complete
MTNKEYVQDRLDILQEEKKEIESQLQYAYSDAKIEQLEEQLREVNHSIAIVSGYGK